MLWPVPCTKDELATLMQTLMNLTANLPRWREMKSHRSQPDSRCVSFPSWQLPRLGHWSWSWKNWGGLDWSYTWELFSQTDWLLFHAHFPNGQEQRGSWYMPVHACQLKSSAWCFRGLAADSARLAVTVIVYIYKIYKLIRGFWWFLWTFVFDYCMSNLCCNIFLKMNPKNNVKPWS